MKTKIIAGLLLFAGIVAGFNSCKKKGTIHKPVNYVFLCDTLDARTQAMFHNLLYDPWLDANDALSAAPPDGYKDITITAYDLSSGDNPRSIIASFPEDNDDDKAREQIADDFMNDLKPQKGSQGPAKNILHALSAAVSEISDPGTEYRLIFCSKMIENSGGPILDPKQNANWKAGHFHFVNTDNNCLTQELNSARLQVDSSRDWINHNLIDLHDSNPEFYRCKVHVSIYQSPADIVSTPEYPCDKNDISKFWATLFEKMQLRVHTYGSIPSVKSILSK